jgi:hypothetical protein
VTVTRNEIKANKPSHAGHAPSTEKHHGHRRRNLNQKVTSNTAEGHVSSRRRRIKIDLASRWEKFCTQPNLTPSTQSETRSLPFGTSEKIIPAIKPQRTQKLKNTTLHSPKRTRRLTTTIESNPVEQNSTTLVAGRLYLHWKNSWRNKKPP